uniref:Reverse transcriptase zinc-binding domain-containing protein n=1 Tax=Oryza brachyantha TaxID=4533 RepID=J3M6H9_ORYBR
MASSGAGRFSPLNDIGNLTNYSPGSIKSLPCTYLGFPLHTTKLRNVDYVSLLDKIGGRVPGWKGKFFTSAGRKTLVKSVLTSLSIYHLTAIQTPKWVIKKIRRAFLWKGEDTEKVATEIFLGDGKKAHFWEDNWLNNRSPRGLAPNLYKLAKRKQLLVSRALENNSWLYSLRQLTTMQEIDELVSLGGLLQEINLLQDVPNNIRWKLTNNGTYSSKSAYEVQFTGSYSPTCSGKLWKADCEPKQR